MAYFEYTPTRTLFQYCSLDSFIGIIGSKELWFSDLASANDPRELRLGYDNFFRALNLARQGTRGSQVEHLVALLEQRLIPYYHNVNVFCSCLSLAEDELPMWGAYGGGYSGLSIGFRPTAVADMPVRVQKVKYLSQNTDGDLLALAVDLAERLDLSLGLVDQVVATSNAFASMTALKHSTWAYEQEIRLTHAQKKKAPDLSEDPVFSFTGFLPNDNPVTWTKPLERTSHSRSIIYLKFPYGRFRDGSFDPSGAIEKVIIGPQCKLPKWEAEAILNENGFKNFTVRKSHCEIR